MSARDELTDARYRAAVIRADAMRASVVCMRVKLRSMIRHLVEPDITGVTSAIAAER